METSWLERMSSGDKMIRSDIEIPLWTSTASGNSVPVTISFRMALPFWTTQTYSIFFSSWQTASYGMVTYFFLLPASKLHLRNSRSLSFHHKFSTVNSVWITVSLFNPLYSFCCRWKYFFNNSLNTILPPRSFALNDCKVSPLGNSRYNFVLHR